MLRNDVYSAISEEYAHLTKSSKKIADYIFSNRGEVQYLSITSLAEEIQVAEATIFRFCRKMGFEGYNDFKLSLAKSESQVRPSDEVLLQGEITPNDSILDMSRKLYTANSDAMLQTLDKLDAAAVELSVQYLSEAQRVYCLGQGGSNVIAMEAWARFITIAPHFQSIQDSHFQVIATSLCEPNDAVLFFSYSGATKDMIDVMTIARQRKAKIILVTHFPKSPGAEKADVTLICGSREGPLQAGSISAKISQMFLIDVLYHAYYRRNMPQTAANQEITANANANKLI